MAIPTTGYASATIANPDSALTDFTLMINLAEIVADEADFSTNWNTDTGGYGRAFKSDGTTELACDFIDLDNSAETGWLRVKYSGTLASTGTQVIWIFPPNTGNALYAADDTYGSDNAYDSSWIGYWPLTTDLNDRTSNGYDGTGQGGISAGDSATGPLGKATTFDGSGDYITVPSGVSSSLNTAAGCTFSVWHQRDGVSSRDVFIDFTVSGTSSKVFMEYQVGNSIRVGGRAADGDDFQSKATNTTFTDTASYHSFIGVMDIANDDIEMVYDDSIQADTGSPAWTSTSFDADVGTLQTIGIAADGSSNPFRGKMADVQFHSGVRATAWRSEEYDQTSDNATFWGTWTWTAGASGISIPVAMNHYRGMR